MGVINTAGLRMLNTHSDEKVIFFFISTCAFSWIQVRFSSGANGHLLLPDVLVSLHMCTCMFYACVCMCDAEPYLQELI